MKKPVIFLIGALYLVSIIVITFFGMQINIDQFTIYMESITIVNDYNKDYYEETGVKYLAFPFNKSNPDANSIFIKYEITPIDPQPSHPEMIKFYIESGGLVNGTTYATIDDKGELYFNLPTTAIVSVMTADGSNKSDNIQVRCFDPSN